MEQESPFAAQTLADTLGALLVGLGLAAACVSDILWDT